MVGGNPNKVNAIVDEIVENNNVFKLKSPIEQDKEKVSIAKSINSVLSVLNEVGKELVLQELSVDPDEKFKGFIDSVGNIDISGLTQMATTIVNAKIEEAEREGIDLRQGQPVFKENSKTLLAEGILTVAIIDTMIKNYEELSNIDKDALARNWNNMLPEQKREYATALGNALKRKAATIEDPNIKNQILEAEQEVRKMPDNEELYNQKLNNMTDEQLQEYVENLYGKNSSLSSLTPEKQREKLQGEFNIRNEKAIIAVQSYENNENPSQIEDIKKASSSYRCNKFAMLGTTKSIPISIEEFSQKSPNEQEAIIYYIENSLSMPLDEFLEDKKHSEPKFDSAKKVKKTDKKILQEIEQLPSALVKAGFSQEEIHEDFTKYISTLKSFEIDDIENFKKWDTEIRKEQLKSFLIEDGMDEKMSEILSKINFNGQLFNILGNEEQKKEFFEQFDKVINQENIQERDTQLDGELEEIFSQYFRDNVVDMNVSAIEAQKEQTNTEQTKQRMLEEEPKEPKLSEQFSPVAETKIASEEHTQETVTSPEHEISEETSQNMAMVEQDNSFIGKIKRVFANMKDMKNKDNSKGFFARLGASIQTVFGNKKEEFYTEQDEISTYDKTEDKFQPATNSQQIDYLNQHFEVNTQEAIRKTEESKKSKEFLSTEDKTADKEEK